LLRTNQQPSLLSYCRPRCSSVKVLVLSVLLIRQTAVATHRLSGSWFLQAWPPDVIQRGGGGEAPETSGSPAADAANYPEMRSQGLASAPRGPPGGAGEKVKSESRPRCTHTHTFRGLRTRPGPVKVVSYKASAAPTAGRRKTWTCKRWHL